MYYKILPAVLVVFGVIEVIVKFCVISLALDIAIGLDEIIFKETSIARDLVELEETTGESAEMNN